MSSTKNRSEGRTLKELEARIEANALERAQEIHLQGINCVKGFCERNGVSVEAICQALILNAAPLLKEVKTNIINEK